MAIEDSGTQLVAEKPETESAPSKGQPEAKVGKPAAGEPNKDKAQVSFSEKDYKELQRKFGKTSLEYKEWQKKLSPYGGADGMLKTFQSAANDKELMEFLQKRQSRTEPDVMRELGFTEEQMKDPQVRAAVQLIEKIADRKAAGITRMEIDRLRGEISPLTEQAQLSKFNESFSTMAKEHGDDWEEMKPIILEMSATLPKEMQENPSLENLEDLFFLALRRSGKFEAYAKKIYQKELEGKKLKSSPKPGVAQGSPAAKKAVTIKDAFRQAMIQHGGS